VVQEKPKQIGKNMKTKGTYIWFIVEIALISVYNLAGTQ
jgi:hypothetical protein